MVHISAPTKKVSILFADISGRTMLYEKLGDQLAQQLIVRCISIMNRALASHHGTLIKTIGDAILCTFSTASPEILTALRAAQKDRMQTTVNIALGASLATVLLTLPVIEAIALLNGDRIVMALTPIQAGMLLLTFLTVMNNLHDGETNAIEGVSHFVLFAAFIALVSMGLI